MREFDVNSPFDMSGLFWIAGQEEKTTPGRIYRTAETIRIQLFEDLRPGPNYIPLNKNDPAPVYEVIDSPDLDKPVTIHGNIGQIMARVTALECITIKSRSTLFGRGPEEYTIAPQRVLFGSLVSGVDHHFTGVRIRT